MAKSTMKSGSNVKATAIDLMIAALDSATTGREKVERSDATAFLQSLIACNDPDTLSDFTRLYNGLKDEDDKIRETNRKIFAEKFGVNKYLEGEGSEAKRTQNFRNRMNRTIATVGFGVNFHALGFWSDLHFEHDGKLVMAKADSKLTHAIWKAQGWINQTKRFEGKRSTSMPVVVQQRAGDRDLGQISWANLASICAGLRGEQGNTVRRAITISPTKPVEALKKISELAVKTNEANFTNASSKLVAIDTAEDILALAIKGNGIDAKMKKRIDDMFEDLREVYRAKMNKEQDKTLNALDPVDQPAAA